ncbi:hypothetical protein Btru_060907 [Bulinus truncatus]|nr:hypothetical protein Btru_060907 [Bulinus truncatus]
MFTFQVIVIVVTVVSVNCICENISFWDGVSNPDQPSCGGKTIYITGLLADKTSVSNVTYMEGAECCSPPDRWNTTGTLVEYADWTNTSGEAKWYVCPRGYFLNGLYRPYGTKEEDWNITTMVAARCVKPATHPIYYRHCYPVTIVRRSYYSQTALCTKTYFVVGLQYSYLEAANMFAINIRCCSMAYFSHERRNFDDFKTEIMSSQLTSMAVFADGLGFNYCLGSRGIFLGEDFLRVNDTWKANAKTFDDDEKCHGERCNDRLSIAYDDWNLAGNTSVTENFEFSQTVEETVAVDVMSDFGSSRDMALSFNFYVPRFDGLSVPYATKIKLSKFNTKQTNVISSRAYILKNQITLEPFSAARYNVTVIKRKKTTTFKAKVIATFSAQFIGMLKGCDEIDMSCSNRHYLYQGTEKFITYRFGDKDTPFYKALKTDSESLSGPWLWYEMRFVDNWKAVSVAMERLIDEQAYEFTVGGFIEYVSETNGEATWESV